MTWLSLGQGGRLALGLTGAGIARLDVLCGPIADRKGYFAAQDEIAIHGDDRAQEIGRVATAQKEPVVALNDDDGKAREPLRVRGDR